MLPTQLGKHFWPDFSYVSGIRIDYLSPTVYLTDLIIVLLFLSVLWRWFALVKSEKFKVQSEKLLLLLFVFIFLIGNILLALRPLLGLYGLLKLLEYFFLAVYLARTIKHPFQLQCIALFFAISSLFESFLAIAQYIHQGSLNGIFYFFGERTFTGATPGIANVSIAGDLILRPYGTLPHPNALAGYLLLSLLFVWFFLLTAQSKILQLVAAASLLIGSTALLLTFSRVAIALWVCFILVLLVKLLVTRLQTTKEKVLTAALLIVALSGLMVLPISHELLTRFTQTSFSEESFTERSELIGAALTLFHQHPLIGVGLDNFLPALAPLQQPMPFGLYLQPVHNIFLLLLTEVGVIGFFLFLDLLFGSVQNIWQMQSPLKYFLWLSFCVISLTGLVDHYWLTLQQGQLLLAIILGLSWTKKVA